MGNRCCCTHVRERRCFNLASVGGRGSACRWWSQQKRLADGSLRLDLVNCPTTTQIVHIRVRII
ncbi:hypothetical protein MPTK1_2g15280 [Marchantia polymorpha subsp. ruderalis]|uniref:Uncharacterized protein n=1 Tax=Marchantia polymorpha TaxID=3197 RepID=A0A2R6WJY2_MARPO|nr:hypothetical protein MARPO_0082s0026 [Marchantia polymorpha]BBN02427.1 hypothetical protein Mp_2g15280 [Marchantia polymorpha subsp. ruderalis]|eukprot:PTQ34175.1 hypothetical protein MARPO_0082s0026 [Marchantia polymorpha]